MECPTNSLSVSARYTDERGEYLMILAAEVGPCGTCGEVSAFFISRAGRSVCNTCDTKEAIAWRFSQQQKTNS